MRLLAGIPPGRDNQTVSPRDLLHHLVDELDDDATALVASLASLHGTGEDAPPSAQQLETWRRALSTLASTDQVRTVLSSQIREEIPGADARLIVLLAALGRLPHTEDADSSDGTARAGPRGSARAPPSRPGCPRTSRARRRPRSCMPRP